MKQLINYLVAAGAVLTLGACHHTHREPSNPVAVEKVAIVPTVAVNDYSRAASDLQTTVFHELTKAGFFVNEVEGTELHTNVKHGVNGGNFKTEGEVMYWPTNGKNLNIYAYAPYKDGTTLADATAFAVSTDQNTQDGYLNSDLLIGTPSGNNPVANSAYTTTGSTDSVAMTFSHKMAKVTLKFTANAPTVKFSKGEATINAATACTFKVSDGTIASPSTVADITVSTEVAVDGSDNATKTYTCSGIIVPQIIAANTQFITLATDNAEFTVTLKEDVTFESGKEYVFNIGLEPEKAGLTTKVDQLYDWTSGSAINATADRTQVIKVGYYLMKDGSYESSSDSKPADAIGMVIKTDNFAKGYKALVLSVLPLQTVQYEFGSGSLGTTYVANSTDITSSVPSGLDMISTIEKNITNFTAFNNTLNNNPYTAGTPSNASKWLIPSAYEMKLILEFFSPEGNWEVSIDKTITEHGQTTIPSIYTPANDTKVFPFDSGETLYWTCTPVSDSKVWVGAIGHSTYPVGIRQASTTTTPTVAYVVPILYSN